MTTTSFDEMKKLMEEMQKKQTASSGHTYVGTPSHMIPMPHFPNDGGCPNCGYCRHCGRGGQPYITWFQITC